jgi:Na+/phosphate symporter
MDFTDFTDSTALRRIMSVYLSLGGMLQSLVLMEEALTVLVQSRKEEELLKE